MYEVTENTKRIFYQTFNRTEQIINDDVNIIKGWIKTQPHLPEVMEDVKIKNFLNLNKFSIEKTKSKIDMYYTIRGVVPELFDNSNPKLDNMQRVFETMYLSTFPVLLNDAHRVFFAKPKISDVFNVQELSKLWLAIFEVRLYEDFMMDDVIIVDMKGFTLNDLTRISPTLLAKGFAVYKKVYAFRMNKMIFLHCPSYMSILLNMLKLVMKPKIFERLQLHQDDAVIKELFSKEVLPKEYGGEGPSLEDLNEMMKNNLDEYQERFDQLDTLRVDEKLRPRKLDNDEILGFYGSFKKISVD